MAFSPIIPSASLLSSNVVVFIFCKGGNERFDRLLSPYPSKLLLLPRTLPSSSVARAVTSGLLAFSPLSFQALPLSSSNVVIFVCCKGCNERFHGLLPLSFQVHMLRSLERCQLCLLQGLQRAVHGLLSPYPSERIRCTPSNAAVFICCKGCNERFMAFSPLSFQALLAAFVERGNICLFTRAVTSDLMAFSPYHSQALPLLLPRTPSSSFVARTVTSGLLAFSPPIIPSAFATLHRTLPLSSFAGL